MAMVRRSRGAAKVDLDSDEVDVLTGLARQVRLLLAGDDQATPAADPDIDPLALLVGFDLAPVAAPDDPALRRLLPDAYRGDEHAAAEFRRFTDADLRATKTAALDALLGSLGRAGRNGLDTRLDRETAVSWLHALADIRLVLGVRLDVTEDVDAQREALDHDDPRRFSFAAYDWLSWLQEMLVHCVSGDS